MPSPVRFTQAKRKFDSLCSEHHYTSNGYYRVGRVVSGRHCIYTIPLLRGRKVKPKHIGLARKRLHITDDEWDAA